MASALFYSLFVTFSLFFVTSTAQEKIPCVDSIYQFGDSLSDTGNLAQIDPTCAGNNLPYGESLSTGPNGRWCNGHLIIDYMAMHLGLPLLNPYLKKNASFQHGVNFAVAGATALNFSFFTERGIETLNISSPLNVQLDWFKTYLNSTASICPNPVEYICAARLRKALFMVGLIGINDFNFALLQGKSVTEVVTYVPDIVGAITKVVRELINLGAVNIVVPGNVPMGCLSSYLSLFPSAIDNAYDEMGCLKIYNTLAVFHNDYLQLELYLIREEFPDVVIIYADYYTAFRSVVSNCSDFDQRLTACCGSGGLYNYNASRTCGASGVNACQNPDEYVNWDGGHSTQETYRKVSNIVIPEILSKIKIECPSISTE